MYKLINDEEGNLALIRYKTDSVLRFIPIAEGNRHYQEYLEWVAEGNTPEPADE